MIVVPGTARPGVVDSENEQTTGPLSQGKGHVFISLAND